MRTLGVVLAGLVAAGCSTALPLGTDDGGADAGGGSCHGLDEAHCIVGASRGCQRAFCCGGFLSCLDPGEQGVACPAACANTCAAHDEQSCSLTPNCRADYCPACSPDSTYFAGCHDANTTPPACTPLPCPAPACTQHMSADACEADPACHGVYQPGACGCAFCCCTFYASCAPGPADCKGQVTCRAAPPPCDDPACNGMYAVGVANGCYEGCVLATKCAP
jgi:hypothetical protein